MLRKAVEEAVRGLKTGKSPGVDSIPSELLQNGGEATTTVLTVMCQKIWEMKEWPKEWTHSLVIPLPKKGNLKQCQNDHTISLISHPSMIMFQVIFNQLMAKAEELLPEEQAVFRPGHSTVEQIFNSHHREAPTAPAQSVPQLHRLADRFDRMWHAGLW